MPPSLISDDLTIAGDLKGEGEVQIDGTVNGDIRCNTLLVGESAKIKGEIIAESVRVHGTVNGQIQAHTVSLARTARVVGNILHENLSTEQGAFLEGHCKRIDTKKERADTPVSLMVKGAGGADTPAKPAASGAGRDPDTGKSDADPKKVAAS
ncbi:MAG: polymer-forming cytoskeletal protein [Rhodospirillales bacterium]|nr:polymer-forming cytoskeletal protein [Rhodospirillales bacterium]